MIPLPEPHIHVTGVGTGERPDWADLRWELAQVLEAMEEGDIFTIQTETSGRVTPIESALCPHCRQTIIRATEGREGGGALEALRECIYC